MSVLSTWMRFDHRGLSQRSKYAHQGGLQIQRGFIASQPYRLGSLLGGVYEFFSKTSSKATTFSSERDLYCLAGRCEEKSHF